MGYKCPNCSELVHESKTLLGHQWQCVNEPYCFFLCADEKLHLLEKWTDIKAEIVTLAKILTNRMMYDNNFGLMEYHNWCADSNLRKENRSKALWAVLQIKYDLDFFEKVHTDLELMTNEVLQHIEDPNSYKKVW